MGISAAAVLLGACTLVGPDFVRPDVPLNPAWLDAELAQYTNDAADLTQWWQVLDDPTLDRLVQMAHEQNNSLEIAGLRVLEAQASLGIATGNRFPQLQVASGDVTAIGVIEGDANAQSRDLSLVQFGLGATVVWELDFWGRFRRGIEAADAALLASVAEYDEVLVLLTAQVADVYTIIRATEEQLRLARESVEIQQRSYEIVRVLFENGASAELDTLQAQSLLLSTQAAIPGLEESLSLAKNALSVLLGVVPVNIDGLLSGEGSLPIVPGQIAAGVPADILRQRPDVRKAELQALAQNALVGVAEAALYPSFSLTGSLGFSATENTGSSSTVRVGFDELFEGSSLSYAIGPSFVWPFLNYGRIQNNVRVEDARLQQALVAYRETVIQAARETEDALTSLASARSQDLILQDAVAVARRSTELSLLRYQEGFADYQRVLSAQQSLFSQQQRYAANRGNVVRSLISVYRSLGGGWAASRQFVDDETRQEMEQRTNWGELLGDTPQ